MNENKRPVYTVDDYYPKRSSYSEDTPEVDRTQELPDAEHKDQEQKDDAHREYNYNNEERDPGTLTCPNCGNKVSGDMNFCSLCGYRFPKSEETPYPLNNTRIDGYLLDDIAAFTNLNYPSYIRKFQKVAAGKISFNWAAAFFATRWLAYRGMFKTALLLSMALNTFSGVVSYIIQMTFQALGTPMSDAVFEQLMLFSFVLSIGVGLVVGLLGDSIYWKHTKKFLDYHNCKDREPVSNPTITRALRQSGGGKITYAAVLIIFDFTFNQLLASLLQVLIPAA